MRLLPPRARCYTIVVLAMLFAVVPSAIATASPIVLSFDVVLLEPASGFASDQLVPVTGAVELNNVNGTNVGALFFDDEYVDVTSNAATTLLTYMIQGGLDDHAAAGYSTAWSSGSAIVFGNFMLDQPGTLVGISATVDQAGGVARVVGAAGGALVQGVDYLVNGFNPNALQIQLFQLGILNQPGQTPLGLMTFNLQFVADQTPNPVPEPGSTLALFGMAMAAIVTRRRLAGTR